MLQWYLARAKASKRKKPWQQQASHDVCHAYWKGFPQPTISKSRQKAAGIDHRGHQFSCILRLFLVSSSRVFCGLSYQERETLRALTSEVHSPFLACPTVRWPCVLDFPLSTACRGRLNMQDRQTAQGIHSVAVLELFTSRPHIAAHCSRWKCWKSTCRLLDGNTAIVI